MKYDDFCKLKALVSAGSYYKTSHCQGADEDYFFYEEDAFDKIAYYILKSMVFTIKKEELKDEE